MLNLNTIAPRCSHVDNNEHSVQIDVTEQGLANLRGLGPMQRAQSHDLGRCLELHPIYWNTEQSFLI